ncbi:hypothetical protein QFZ35_003913 [Arthrobacter ulcerisalmonis]|nr:hypothetical protein [Arthrobacter ulcerisalmonis]MDQ0665415.1 hypothetical protein [Arthrobacter ulcerisalmonis]
MGFLVRWAILLDYLFLPMVIWLIGGSYLSAQFPGIPIGLWIVGFIVITTLLNILGIKVADKANYVLMAFQLLVIVFFVALSIGNVVSTSGAGGLVSSQPFVNDTANFATISASAAIAAYSFLGSTPSLPLPRRPSTRARPCHAPSCWHCPPPPHRAGGRRGGNLDEPGRAYNTLVGFGPDGGRLASYRKIHLFDAQGFGESEFIKPGPSTDPVVFGYGAGACWWIRWALWKLTLDWRPVCGRWKSRWRPWTESGSRSQCSGSEGCRNPGHLVKWCQKWHHDDCGEHR